MPQKQVRRRAGNRYTPKRLGPVLYRREGQWSPRACPLFRRRTLLGGMHGILTMSTEFLPPEAGLMLGSEMTVLGKVTSVLDQEDSTDLLRRSSLGYFPQERVQQLLDQLDTSLRLSLPQVVIRGPGVQLVPLAVFV
jgi:hypothetical protein